eukprot:1162035-Pelagomonas_calceolata.AAC.5
MLKHPEASTSLAANPYIAHLGAAASCLTPYLQQPAHNTACLLLEGAQRRVLCFSKTTTRESAFKTIHRNALHWLHKCVVPEAIADCNKADVSTSLNRAQWTYIPKFWLFEKKGASRTWRAMAAPAKIPS